MKTCLFVVLLFLVKLTIAQNDEKIKPDTPINSGFVFIDGKYIEPPYKFSYKYPCKIYLNNHLFYECTCITDTIANPYKIDKLPDIPKSLDISTSFKELESIKYDNNRDFLTAVCHYFYTHYYNKEAERLLISYLKKLPNLKEIKNGKFIFYNGDEVYLDFAPLGNDFFEKYGIHSHPKITPKSKIRRRGENYILWMQKILIANGMINSIYLYKNRTVNTISSEKDIFRINNYINYLGLDSTTIPSMVIKNLREKINEYRQTQKNPNNNLQNNINVPIIKSNIAFSPLSNQFFAVFPSTWDNDAFGNYQTEYYNLLNYLSGYSYASNNCLFLDNTPNDDFCNNLSYGQVVSVADNTGVLLISTHGRPPNDPDTTHYIDNGFFIWYATNEEAIKTWCGNDPLVHPTKIINKPPSWMASLDLWGAFVQADWVENYWESKLEQNKSIAVLSSCYSYANGMVNSCKGGIAFGYDNESYEFNSIENEKQLFKRMNGNIDNGLYREATVAYYNMPFHYDGFVFSNNHPITLCPAPLSKYPDNVATVGLQGDGWFEVDTYCDATIPINEQDPDYSPIAFEWTNPGLSISNVHWDDPDGDGLSNKIVFHWESTTNNTVFVKINHNYWRSAPSINGQYHLLDYNKVTPNTEDGQYSFNISSNVPTQPPVADFSYTISGNTVYFQDQSTNTPTSWHWDFGDGQSSTLQNVSHTYTNTGNYSVTLTVSNTYGSSSKTKMVSVTNTPQTVIVSGVVENADNFAPIAGATVSCAYGSTTTDNFGHYSLQVPYNQSNCGSITASKTGFQSSSACSCNNLISDISCNFNLFPVNLYIYTQANVHSVGLGFAINFYSSYTNGQEYYWEIFDNNNNLIYFQNTFSWSLSYTFFDEGNFKIMVTVNNMTSPPFQIEVKNISCECAGFSIGSTCHVIKTNQSVTFWNIGNVPDNIKNEDCLLHPSCYKTGRRWITAYGTPYENRTEIYPWGGTNPSDPWYYTTSFSYGGKYSIKYEIISELTGNQYMCDWQFSPPHVIDYPDNDNSNPNKCFYYGEIIVVDCNAYSACNSSGCPNSIPGWDEMGRFHQWSGTFNLNQQANTFVNNQDLILSACNEIILDDGFIADGTHEFIAEIEDFNCHSDKFEQYINSFQQNDSVQNKWIENNYISIYPNPFNNEINVSSLEKNIQSIHLYNILGKLVFNDNYFTKNCKIDTYSLHEGVYVIEIVIDNIPYRVKLLKQVKI